MPLKPTWIGTMEPARLRRGARYYDAEIGRFLTIDPLAHKMPDINPCHNNPLLYIDPDGMEDEKTHTNTENTYTYNGDNSHTVTTTTTNTTTVSDGDNVTVTTETNTMSQTYTMNSDGTFTTTGTGASSTTTQTNYVMKTGVNNNGSLNISKKQVGETKTLSTTVNSSNFTEMSNNLNTMVGHTQTQLLANGVQDGANLFQQPSTAGEIGYNGAASISAGLLHPAGGVAVTVISAGAEIYKQTADFTGKTGRIVVKMRK